ncbi:hypothetical protein, partial [Paraburkholderia sp. NMBU_R16]|uniref:hypothetical protein n=1 Tax=Paraburkholderia sp. NMBU_R16 TaxID=2698676 RepID=UPI001C27EC83
CNMRRASINKRLSASINIGIINLAATFSSCLSRVSHPDCRATTRHYCDSDRVLREVRLADQSVEVIGTLRTLIFALPPASIGSFCRVVYKVNMCAVLPQVVMPNEGNIRFPGFSEGPVGALARIITTLPAVSRNTYRLNHV